MGSRLFLLAAAALLTASLAMGQGGPRVTGVDPTSGKVDSNLSVMGEGLGKESVTNVYLSNETTDYKATVLEQTAEKIVVKVPEVKAGSYSIAVQVGNNIFIQPIRFKVEE